MGFWSVLVSPEIYAVPVLGWSIEFSAIVAVTKHKSAMQLLTLHRELMDDEINQFQDLVDDFFCNMA